VSCVYGLTRAWLIRASESLHAQLEDLRIHAHAYALTEAILELGIVIYTLDTVLFLVVSSHLLSTR
jgi:hypothetical protein